MSMTSLCVTLLCVGLSLLTIEMFVPGFGVFGIMGLISVVASAFVAVLYVEYGWIIVVAEIVLLAVIIFIMFRFVKKRKLKNELFMRDTLNEDAPRIADPGIYGGKEGTTKTSLRPFGDVDFSGFTIEVTSDGEYLEKGVRVKATGVQAGKLVVCKI